MPVADFGRCSVASSTAPAANAQGGGHRIAPRQAQADRQRQLTAEKLSTQHYVGKSLIHILSYRMLT
jgi:hypothetical protein